MIAIDLKEKIRCLKREVAFRERVYPRWVGAKKMKQSEADREIAALKEVLHDYEVKVQRPDHLLTRVTYAIADVVARGSILITGDVEQREQFYEALARAAIFEVGNTGGTAHDDTGRRTEAEDRGAGALGLRP